jgi:hypothetical protein
MVTQLTHLHDAADGRTTGANDSGFTAAWEGYDTGEGVLCMHAGRRLRGLDEGPDLCRRRFDARRASTCDDDALLACST